ncbi:MAG: matrixin family metalloprotease [Acidobacteriota bacterium]
MRRAPRLLPVVLVTAAALTSVPDAPRGGGNLEVLNPTSTKILNAAWDPRTLPVKWLINGGLFTTSQLRPPLEAAFDTWQNLPDSDWAFSFNGTTTDNFAAADGKNIAVFGATFAMPPDFLAVTPCTAKNVAFTVADTGGPPPDVLGDGLGWIVIGSTNVLLAPIGDYPAGTVVDCDTIFATAHVCSNNANILCDPTSFSPFSVCGSFFATCDPLFPLTFDRSPGTEDIQGLALHEFGHFGTLSHSTLPSAIMYPFTDTNPPGDGINANRVLKQDDISAAGHYYGNPTFVTTNARITGRVTIMLDDGNGMPAAAGGDGVSVTALDANTLEPVEARFSYSFFMDPADRFDGADRTAFGDGYYVLEVPPGSYYVYAEWFDGRDDVFFGQRLFARHNQTVASSGVANGDPTTGFTGAFGFLPERFEFFNAAESGDGGDGTQAGAAADNPDAGTVITVAAGDLNSGNDIVINLDPDVTKTKAARSNPTGVFRLDLTPFDRPAILALDNDGNDDDWWIPHFTAAEMPTPPYNVLEAVWTKLGLANKPYVGGLLLSDPADPSIIEPFIVHDARRTVTGWDGGNTGNTDIFEVRDRFNVTVTEPRDLYFAIKVPESPPGIMFGSEGYFALTQNNGICSTNTAIQCSVDADCPSTTCSAGVCANDPANTCAVAADCPVCNIGSTGRSLLTPDDFATIFVTNTFDVMYRVKTETAPPVMLTGASPATLTQGETGTVATLTGNGFVPGAQVDVLAPTFGPHVPSGVTVTSVNVVNSTSIQVTVDVDPAAIPSILDVKLTNPEVVIPNWARLMSLAAAPDSDGDGIIDPLDCLPADPTLWSVPGSTGGTLQVQKTGADTARILWAPPVDLGGTAGVSIVTDATRGVRSALLASGGLDFGSCLANDLTANEVSDATTTPVGETTYYMVAPQNGCGRGPFTGPSGSPNRNANPGNCSP